MGILKTILFSFCVTITFFPDQQVSATDYYMAVAENGGNDSNTGLDLSKPFATISKFNDIAKPGDILYIRGGWYYPREVILTKSGSYKNPITIKNYPGEVPIFNGQRDSADSGINFLVLDDGIYSGVDGTKHDWIFEGLVVINWKRGGFHFGDCNKSHSNKFMALYNILIKNCLVDYCGQQGIRITHADSIEIVNCVVSRTGWDINYGSWSSGINLYNCVGTHIRVSSCVSFHHIDVSHNHTDGNGLILDMFEAYDLDAGATIENCLFFENGGAGIAWTRNDHANINNCTLYENSCAPDYISKGYGLVLWRDEKQSRYYNDINLRNNIIYQSSGKGFKTDDTIKGGTIANNNISGEPGSNTLQLLDPQCGFFSLNRSSALKNAGTPVNTPSGSIGFDKNVIKYQNTDQPISWFRWAPDLSFVIQRGGLANCFNPVKRDGSPDIGAFESNEN